MPGRQLIMSFPVTATSHALPDYRARGGYGALAKTLGQMKPQDVVKEVTASGLQGRGGAAFAVGRKWQVVQYDDGQPHYLIANADEGEPGTFKDRWILENNPHVLLESMLIASYALNVRNCFVYIRGEFDLPYRRLADAVEEAYAAGLFGRNILGSDFSCDIVVYRGAGAYVAGEASGLISSLEGKKGYPRNRPPTADGQGAVPASDGRQQRRVAVEHRLDHQQRRRRLQGRRHAQEPGHAPLLGVGPHQPSRRLRSRTRLPVDEVPRRRLRRQSRMVARSSASCLAGFPPRCSPAPTSRT